jgi:co-chaperonin GroES (HSP10)
MRSPHFFIAEPIDGKRYANVAENGLVLSVSQEDHKTTNRQAKIIALPLSYKGGAQVGDTLLVHHNTFRKYLDMKGREKSGPSYFRDNLYFIFDDQWFMCKHDGQWIAPSPYCFIKPTNEPLIGIIKYMNDYMGTMGLKVGDKVAFQPDSEYEFNIEGEKLYRMFTRNLTLKL